MEYAQSHNALALKKYLNSKNRSEAIFKNVNIKKEIPYHIM